MPIETNDGSVFATNKGHTLVCMEFKMTNNDRSSLHVADYGLEWYIDYKDESYPLMKYDLM